MHLKHVAVLALLLASLSCQADPNAALTLADINAKSAVKVTKEELQGLLLGAKVRNIAATGSTRNWVNEADGKLSPRRTIVPALPRARSQAAREAHGRSVRTAPIACHSPGASSRSKSGAASCSRTARIFGAYGHSRTRRPRLRVSRFPSSGHSLPYIVVH
jgi:hypothetical protein